MRLGLGLLLLCLAVSAPAQDLVRRAPYIRATGEATVSAKPDRARIEIGVVTQAPTAQAATQQNAARLDAVIRELKKAAPQGTEIRTTGFSVTPNYNFPREGGKPTIAGYNASNVVEVTTDDVAAPGPLIDTALKAGANQVQRLQFVLRDPQAAKSQALREATAKARASVEALAAAAGVKILRIASMEEGGGGPPVRPMEMMMARAEAAAAAPTPIEAGNIEVQAQVTLTVEIAQ